MKCSLEREPHLHADEELLVPKALGELREILGHTVSILTLNVFEFILERQLPLVAFALE